MTATTQQQANAHRTERAVLVGVALVIVVLSAALLAEHSDVDDLADLTLLREELLEMGEEAATALCPRTWHFLQRDDVVPLVVRDTCV